MFTVVLHPALGGIAVFTLMGIAFDLKADPLAIWFSIYVVTWALITDIMNYLGWNRENFG